ncbi:hypothetical protein Neosp_005588 [[Neocosmospora] mangrovei]
MSSALSTGLQDKLRDIIDEYTSGGTDRKIPGLVYLAFRNDGQPIFQHCSGTRGMSSQDLITLKTSAGFGYAFEDDKLAEYTRPVGADDFSGEAVEIANRPLVNQPGEKFQYGISMDWVGVMIERVSGKSLDEYFKTNIFQPLGMDSVTFHPSEEAKANMAYMHRRSADEKLATTDHFYRRPLLAYGEGNKAPCAGGHGCFGKPAEFGRLISLLLNDGIDKVTGVRLLKPETVKDMFTDQIADKPRYSNVCVPVAKPELANPTPLTPMPDDHTEGWGMSFSISHFPSETGRAAGTASWEGLANLFWFADRKNNIGGIIASQIIPYGGRFFELIGWYSSAQIV